ncbi:hypothetical protein [Ferdinandcohnia sp. SAFN-114]|uniref:hypothetical protein n=1 Tax=Ferdinandcohnia sp. SAFN-114 TaxID=3387275 RepID=UPI003F7D8E2E
MDYFFVLGLKIGFIVGIAALVLGIFFTAMFKSWKKEKPATKVITGFLIIWFLSLIILVFLFGNEEILNPTMKEWTKIITISSTAVGLIGLIVKSFHKEAKSLSFGWFLFIILLLIGTSAILDKVYGGFVYFQNTMSDIYTLITATFIFSTPYLSYLIEKRMDEKKKNWKRLKINSLTEENDNLKKEKKDLKKEIKDLKIELGKLNSNSGNTTK